jgi:hypothetical protein
LTFEKWVKIGGCQAGYFFCSAETGKEVRKENEDAGIWIALFRVVKQQEAHG